MAVNDDAEAPQVFAPPPALKSTAHIRSLDAYRELYSLSATRPDEFWRDEARNLHFAHWSDRGLESNIDVNVGRIAVRFMAGAKTNVAFNCLDRHVAQGLGDKIAFHWIGNEPECRTSITYAQLLEQVKTFAAVLRAHGVRRGHCVAIYMPMCIEVAVAMLACARIGAPHSVVFAGFSAESLAERLWQAKCALVVTADGFRRGDKLVALKPTADRAIELCGTRGHNVPKQVVLEHAARSIGPLDIKAPIVAWKPRDVRWSDAMTRATKQDIDAPIDWSDAEDMLFILYTSGSTGVPKGIVHTTAGFMTYAYSTLKYVFDLQPEDVAWSMADVGWITGHTQIVYGPLLNGVTSVIFEGLPTYPSPARIWQEVERLKVTKMYTSPTAIRTLMAYGDEPVKSADRSSLQLIGTVGEPINQKAWLWLHDVVGERRAAICDTYWQTETGSHMITPLPAATPTKPGAATLPFFGVRPVLLDNDGKRIEGEGEGNLCFETAWPGISRTILNDHPRYTKTYFRAFPGFYFTGDGARRDADGYFWVTGRVDDLINVSGHLLSTAGIESALAAHSAVVEAAVVAVHDEIRGHVPYAFVVTYNNAPLTSELVDELKLGVRKTISPIAMPECIQHAPGLPKTRSGKVTRRILRTIAENERDKPLGDTSTLIDVGIIDQLWATRDDVQKPK